MKKTVLLIVLLFPIAGSAQVYQQVRMGDTVLVDSALFASLIDVQPLCPPFELRRIGARHVSEHFSIDTLSNPVIVYATPLSPGIKHDTIYITGYYANSYCGGWEYRYDTLVVAVEGVASSAVANNDETLNKIVISNDRIVVDEDATLIELRDLLGRCVAVSSNSTLLLTTLPAGTYLLSVHLSKTKFTKVIIIR